jgi:2-dehydro-3-deoxyphosphogalactonate aldolase
MLSAEDQFDEALAACPLIAILRGVRPDEAVTIAEATIAAGFRIVEVPLNSPEPFESIARLATLVGGRALVGAGTVLTEHDVHLVAEAGGRAIIAPNMNAAVIRTARRLGLVALPGVATPTEAFSALEHGANALKLFPAEATPPAVVKAMLAVLPKGTRLIPVGGITPALIPAYAAAGAKGFGIGSAVYKPGMTAAAVHSAASAFVAAI